MKLFQSVDSLYELIYSGVLERFPKLKVVLVENELGWIPFVLEQWDYYFKRLAQRRGPGDQNPPSEYFHNQIYTTFFNDAVGGQILRGGASTTACGPTISRTATHLAPLPPHGRSGPG